MTTLPTLTLNSTDPSTLFSTYEKIKSQLDFLLETLYYSPPHPRDFPEEVSYHRALNEHAAHIRHIVDMTNHYLLLLDHTGNAIHERKVDSDL
jgi:hypothetical protein